jgi:hypothetical protein
MGQCILALSQALPDGVGAGTPVRQTALFGFK